MKFVSIDIETTGLNEKTCQIIEVGAVIDDTLNPMGSPPEFHCYVLHNGYHGESYALSMHSEIFRRISCLEDGYKYLPACHVWGNFRHWLMLNSEPRYKWTIAGKNYAGFDDRFLRLLPDWDFQNILRHRVLDPGSMLMRPDDECVPDTKECMRRCGLEGEVAHTALEDAKIVAKMIHYAMGDRCST